MRREAAPWPESYYLETAPQKRWELLQEAISSGKIDQEEAALREKLWKRRYGEKTSPKAQPRDGYIALWVTMNVHARDINSRFRRRGIIKEIQTMLDQLGIDDPQASAQEKELTQQELFHAMEIYYSTCSEGTYNSQIFGLMRMKKDRLIDKIIADVYLVAYEMPAKMELSERFAPLRKAAYDAFCETYPDEAERMNQAIFGAEER